MNTFFIVMILLLGSRTFYYMFTRFNNWKLSRQPIENVDLIPVYIGELFFNFVMFFNIIVKNDHDTKLSSVL